MPKVRALGRDWTPHPALVLSLCFDSLPRRMKNVLNHDSGVEPAARRAAILNFPEDDDLLFQRDLDLGALADRGL